MKLSYTISALAFSTLLMTGCQTTPMGKPTHLPHPPHPHLHSHPHPHPHSHWGYQAPDVLPEHWGDEEVNKLCQAGQAQSPINIKKVQKPAVNQFNLVANYQPQDFTVTNNGHTVVYDATNPATNTLTINGVAYQLLQFHYHIPSEHTVMDNRYPLELHFVHQNAQKQLAVVGVLVQAGADNANLQRILTDLPTTPTAKGSVTQLNVATLMPTASQTYAYDGSLTTPPCSEQVQWLLKATPITASQTQINQLAKLYQGNNRPIQPNANRPVYMLDN